MNGLYFGYSDCIITPSAAIGLLGYEKRDDHGFNNSGVMDDLYARALSLKWNDRELMLITLDLCMLDEKTADFIRSSVSQKLKLPMENIMLCASHTHSGPRTMSGPYEDNPSAVNVISAYVDNLKDKVVTICSQASCLRFRCKLSSAVFSARLGYNRRFVRDSGYGKKDVKMLFTLWRNPEHIPNGLVDTDIPVLLLERQDESDYDPFLCQTGVNQLVLFNVPIHPVVLGEDSRYVSADYPGAAARCIERTIGNGTKAMFLLGACGNVNPYFACQNSPKAVEIIGNAIGYGICSALSGKKEIVFDGLKAFSERLPLENGKGLSRVVTQVFKIGKAAIAAFSCECFTELGIRVRKESGFEQTLVATNANGGCGYIPTGETWDTEGGYEMDSAEKTGFDRDTLDKLGDIAGKALRQLSCNSCKLTPGIAQYRKQEFHLPT